MVPNRRNYKSALLASLVVTISCTPSFAQSGPSDFTSAKRYDLLNRVTGTIAADPDGPGGLAFAAVRNTYDASGRLVKVEKGQLSSWQSENIAPADWGSVFTIFSTAEVSYDNLDRKVMEIVKGSSGSIATVTQYAYDIAGRLECTAVRMNSAAYGALPASACTLGAQGSQGPDRITRNVYDKADQLVQVRKAVGTSIEVAEATYSYTSNGKQEYVIDAVGNRAKLEYDGFDRQAKWIFPSTAKPDGFNPSSPANALATAGSLNTADYEQYSYDANGNRTSLRKRDGSTITSQYDALNRVVVRAIPERAGLSSTHTRDIYYGYDPRGHQLFARFDSTSGEGVTDNYNGFGEIVSSTLGMDGVSRTLAYQYDKDGNRIKIVHPDGVFFTMCYDGLDRLDKAWWTNSGIFSACTGATQFVDINYNARGLRDSINRASSYTDYVSDDASRLGSLVQRFAGNVGNVTQNFGYNQANQILTRTTGNTDFVWTGHYNVNREYTANGLNQYTAAGTANFGYDANGNLISDGSTSFVYDIENRLVGASGAKSAALRYDPLGRLYEINGPSGITRFLYDGDHIVGEYADNGTLLRRYFWGARADEPVLWDEGSAMNCSGTKFLHGDHQGSIIAVADCWGNRTNINRYDEYGIPQQPGNAGRFQYTGQAWLPDIGMSYYKARMYSPTLGRFMQTDPIGYQDQINLYAYTRNDPVNAVDGTGKKVEISTHEVGASFWHLKIVVVPQDQGRWRDDERFQTAPDGTVYTTVGGGPDSDLNILGDLRSGFNRERDVSELMNGNSLTLGSLEPGEGVSENTMIEGILTRAENFKNGLYDYSLFPALDPFGGKNSNGFVVGLLQSMGTNTDALTENTFTTADGSPINTPGVNNPPPPEAYCPPPGGHSQC